MKRILALVFLFAAATSLAADLSLSIQPLFEGRSQTNGPNPFVATVANRGADAVGHVATEMGQSGSVLHPVNLPRGSVKRITLIVPVSAQYEQIRVTLDTDQGRVSKVIQPEYGYSGAGGALQIGGSSGDMAFLAQKTVMHVGAAAAPERPILYSGFDYVVLGESAERMSDAASRALQVYLVAGGRVLLLGGASSPILHDPRWTPILPMRPTGVREVRVPTSVEKWWGRPMPDTPITVTVGPVASSSQVRVTAPVPLVVERAVGQGLVVQFAFNPFDEPLRTWPGLEKLFARYLPPSSGAIQSIGRYSQYEQSTAIPGSPGATSMPAPLPQQDAFTLEVPPWGKMLTLLIAYAVVVVPVNLLLLRKVRRSEWAWLTAPLVSVGFAGAFFSFAGDLYRTPLSTATDGTLTWDARLPEGYFTGRTQLFVPRGGRYDLGLTGIDFLGNEAYDEYGMGTSQRTALDLVDTGSYSAPKARFTNLTYHSVVYAQIVPTGGWLRTAVAPRKGNRVQLKITNGSPYPWSHLELRAPGAKHTLSKLPPGETWIVPQEITLNDSRKPTQPSLLLVGTLEGFRPGPQLGRDVTRVGGTRFNVAVDAEVLHP